MDGEINWPQLVAVGLGAVGTTVIGIATGALIVWQKFNAIRVQEAKDAAELKRADGTLDDERRIAHANIQHAADERVVNQWKSLWEKMEVNVAALKAENEKRRLEHFECIQADAKKAAKIEYLEKSDAEKTHQIEMLTKLNSELHERVLVLERKGGGA